MLLWLFSPLSSSAMFDFDDLSVTSGINDLPQGSATINYGLNEYGLDEYSSTDSSHQGGAVRLWRYTSNYNSSHMGFSSWGWLDIDDSKAVSGNSLRCVITGGRNSICNPCDSGGLIVNKKQDYLDYLSVGQNPVGTIAIGVPDIYFGNSTGSSNPMAMWPAVGNNRLSLYVKYPESLAGADRPGNPRVTIHVAPFTTDFGGHYYQFYAINGGGWTHLQLDRHPSNDNISGSDAVNKPAHDEGFIGRIYRFYVTANLYEGYTIPPHYTYFDNIEFWNDDYANQNDETINGLGISYNPATKFFQVTFNDKYRGRSSNPGMAKATYEIRYSLSEPITNENWDNATPCHIQATTTQTERVDGKFKRVSPDDYTTVWAKFALANSSDEMTFENNKIIHFAIKDISQNPENHRQINPALDGTLAGWGRNYDDGWASWDYENDNRVLDYIKRISYILSENTDLEVPSAPVGLSVS
jgi:hypothetical protein